ncbi:MAG: hemagglutination protein, partial [Alteromonadales bacterium]|nr:hemagglutination protein [Alteromonadales bacterium]
LAGENVGTYAITKNTLALNDNYNLSFVANDLTINKRSIEITANNKTKLVGSSDPVLDYTISKGNMAFSDLLAGSLNRVSGETVKSYAINKGSLDAGANYNMNFVSGAFVITNLQTQGITFNALTDVVYGDANFALTANGGASGNPVTFVSSDETVAKVSGNTVTIIGAGTATITASQVGNATYAAAANVNQTLTVAQKAIEITADAVSKTYGDADVALTYKITSGLLIGSDTFTGTLSRVSGENVGTYALTKGSVSNANYSINFVSKDLTITKKAIEITADAKSKTYGDADPTLTYQITSGSLVGSDSFTGTLSRVAGENIGAYALNNGS